jgi:hypothetical protein
VERPQSAHRRPGTWFGGEHDIYVGDQRHSPSQNGVNLYKSYENETGITGELVFTRTDEIEVVEVSG